MTTAEVEYGLHIGGLRVKECVLSWMLFRGVCFQSQGGHLQAIPPISLLPARRLFSSACGLYSLLPDANHQGPLIMPISVVWYQNHFDAPYFPLTLSTSARRQVGFFYSPKIQIVLWSCNGAPDGRGRVHPVGSRLPDVCRSRPPTNLLSPGECYVYGAHTPEDTIPA